MKKIIALLLAAVMLPCTAFAEETEQETEVQVVSADERYDMLSALGIIKNYKDELEVIINELNKYKEEYKKDNTIKDYTPTAKILTKYLENLSDEDILTPETLNFLISKIYVKAYGKRVNHRYLNKEITIEYNNIDEIIKEFVAYEDEQPSSNIC